MSTDERTVGSSPKTVTMYVTMAVENQLFGIQVTQVQDVLGPQKITYVPLAPVEVLGSLNLRGRIVTSIDVRTRLGLPISEKTQGMNIVVEQSGELFALKVDRVGEVMSLDLKDFEQNPATLDQRLSDVSEGIYRLKDGLLVVLNVTRLLRLDQAEVA